MITGSVAITAGILQHCRAQGIRVPEDLALVSTGTFAYPGIIEPSLTHLDDCVEETAAQLLALLERAIAGEPIAPDISIAIEPVLRIGASPCARESYPAFEKTFS